MIFKIVFNDGENLSFDDCGLWSGGMKNTPWTASIERDGGGRCSGVLISRTTILTRKCLLYLKSEYFSAL
jgi:hypothetical protein